MRIGVVTTSYPQAPGDPSGHFVEAEVRALAAQGHDVVVISPGKSNDAFGWPGVMARLEERPTRALGVARFVYTAARRLRELGPFERVIAHWVVPCAWPIARGLDVPLEVVCHGSDVRLLERMPRPLARRLVNTLLDRGARFRFVSRELRDRLARHTGDRVALASSIEPCPIDVRRAPTRRQARARLGIAEERALVLVVARLIASKRVDVALSAATLLPADVVVVGDGPERAELERRFPEVRFVGQVPRPEALAWIAAADALLAASRDEGAPTVIREARALGVPVIATRAGDLAHWAASDPEISVVL